MNIELNISHHVLFPFKIVYGKTLCLMERDCIKITNTTINNCVLTVTPFLFERFTKHVLCVCHVASITFCEKLHAFPECRLTFCEGRLCAIESCISFYRPLTGEVCYPYEVFEFIKGNF